MRASSSRYSSRHLSLVGVGRPGEVDQARQPVHHQRVGVVAEAVGVGDREAVRLEQVVHRDLVGDAAGIAMRGSRSPRACSGRRRPSSSTSTSHAGRHRGMRLDARHASPPTVRSTHAASRGRPRRSRRPSPFIVAENI